MPTYSIASGSYDGHVRVYDVRMGQTTVDVLAHPVTSVRCSADGNALLISTLDSYIRMLDRTDGKLLAAFGGPPKTEEKAPPGLLTRPRHTYRNSELRVRSVFAQGDGVVLSGSEAPKDDQSGLGAAVFAWDILTGENVATVPMGQRMKAVSCVAWNEKGYWAAGCPDGIFPSPIAILWILTDYTRNCARLWLIYSTVLLNMATSHSCHLDAHGPAPQVSAHEADSLSEWVIGQSRRSVAPISSLSLAISLP